MYLTANYAAAVTDTEHAAPIAAVKRVECGKTAQYTAAATCADGREFGMYKFNLSIYGAADPTAIREIEHGLSTDCIAAREALAAAVAAALLNVDPAAVRAHVGITREENNANGIVAGRADYYPAALNERGARLAAALDNIAAIYEDEHAAAIELEERAAAERAAKSAARIDAQNLKAIQRLIKNGVITEEQASIMLANC